MFTLKDTLETVSKYIPSQLINEKSFSYIKDIARLFPAGATSAFGFESRLNESSAVVDFAFCVKETNGERDIISGNNSFNKLPDYLFSNFAWKRINDFYTCWANPEHPFYGNINQIWLEFDINGSQSSVPIPGFLFGINKKFFDKTSNQKSEWNTNTYQSFICNGIEILFKKLIIPKVRENLKICCEFLPPGSRIVQTGVMLSRNKNAIRIYINGIKNKEQLFQYLNNIGWTGKIDEFRKVVTKLFPFVKAYAIGLDLGDRIFPRIGLECYLDHYPKSKTQRKLFIDYLIKNKLCTVEKGNVIINWHGHYREILKHELWFSILVQIYKYIKIVYQPDLHLQAKGYMGFVHKWEKSIYI